MVLQSVAWDDLSWTTANCVEFGLYMVSELPSMIKGAVVLSHKVNTMTNNTAMTWYEVQYQVEDETFLSAIYVHDKKAFTVAFTTGSASFPSYLVVARMIVGGFTMVEDDYSPNTRILNEPYLEKTKEDPDLNEWIVHRKDDVSIALPSSWSQDHNVFKSNIIRFICDRKEDCFKCVNVFLADFTAMRGMTTALLLAELAKVYIAEVKRQPYNVVVDQKIVKEGEEVMSYIFVTKGRRDMIRTKSTSYISLFGRDLSRGNVITFTCDERVFEQYLPLAHYIINSFKCDGDGV